MGSHALKPALVLCAVFAVACAGPGPVTEPSTTIDERAGTTEMAPTTTSTLAETATTSSTTTPSSLAPTTVSPTSLVPVAGDPPEIDLKPPGLMDGFSLDEIEGYFIFRLDVGPSFTTLFQTSDLGGTSSVLARSEDQYVHYTLEGEADGEVMVGDGTMWLRDHSGNWVRDVQDFLPPMMMGMASPDFAYGYAYHAFEHLDFEGWVQENGQRMALYRGGAAAAVAAGGGDTADADEYDGSGIEAWWSPDGYFAKVKLELVDLNNEGTLNWTITEVGTTEVEPPA